MVRRLGKAGRGELLSGLVQRTQDMAARPNPEAQVMPLAWIEANPWQPRQHADAERMQELIADVQQRGILQPIVVRPMGERRYQVVAGERRYRAATALALETVPVIVKEMDDDEARAVSLIENLQREDLDIEDEARFLKALQDGGLSLRQIADAIHKSHNYVMRRIRLLERPGALTAYRAGTLNLNTLMNADDEGAADVPMAEVSGSLGTTNQENTGGSLGTTFRRQRSVFKPFQKFSAQVRLLDLKQATPQEQTDLRVAIRALRAELDELETRLPPLADGPALPQMQE